MTTRVNLSDWKAERRRTGALVEIETDDGEVYCIDPPELWPDSVVSNIAAQDMEAVGRGILGDRYDVFVEHGGSATIISKIIEEAVGGSTGE